MDLNAFFDKAHSVFTSVTVGKTLPQTVFKVGDQFAVRLLFANQQLMTAFLPAVSHVVIEDPVSFDLTISIWDSSNGEKKPPYPSWQSSRNYSWVDLLTSDTVRVHCEANPARLSAISLERSEALFWIKDMSQLPWYEQCRPLRTLLHWWGTTKNLSLLHAAAVGTDDGAVLLVGPGGSGKSTTALACLRAGMHYLADDHCMVGFKDLRPHVYSLYNSAKLNAVDSLSMLPEFEKLVVNKDRLSSEKAMMFVPSYAGTEASRGLPLRAVLVPQVTANAETKLMPISWNGAAKALIPSTMTELAGAEVEDFYAMMKLIKSLPCFRLELGSDMDQIPDAIKKLLSSMVLTEQLFRASPVGCSE